MDRSDAPACEVEKQLGLWYVVGSPQTSNAHLFGTRVGIVVARTIRRLLASEPPPASRTSEETDVMMLAAVQPYGHEDPLEISRTEFESFVRDGWLLL